VLSINDYPLNGLTDMEAFSFFTKSGPVVKLKVIRGVYLEKGKSVYSVQKYHCQTTPKISCLLKKFHFSF